MRFPLVLEAVDFAIFATEDGKSGPCPIPNVHVASQVSNQIWSIGPVVLGNDFEGFQMNVNHGAAIVPISPKSIKAII
jgi:hypothetical protein